MVQLVSVVVLSILSMPPPLPLGAVELLLTVQLVSVVVPSEAARPPPSMPAESPVKVVVETAQRPLVVDPAAKVGRVVGKRADARDRWPKPQTRKAAALVARRCCRQMWC